MKRTYRRRQYFIDRDFQSRFIGMFVLIRLAGMVASVGMFYLLAAREIDGLMWKMTIRPQTVAEIVYPYLLSVGAFAVLFTSATLFAFLRRLKSRMNNSLRELQKSLITVRDGNLTLDVSLSREHSFHDTSEDLDAMVSSIRNRFKLIKNDFASIKGAIDSLPDIRDELLPQRCHTLSMDIENLRDSLQENIEEGRE